MSILVARYHVNLAENIVVVEYQTKDPDTGFLTPPLGTLRATLDAPSEIVDALNAFALPLLDAKLDQVQGARSEALTGELHRLHQANVAHADITRRQAEAETKTRAEADKLVELAERRKAEEQKLAEVTALVKAEEEKLAAATG